jgi:hypothetical protein
MSKARVSDESAIERAEKKKGRSRSQEDADV